MTRPSHLPDYENPPLVEVVTGFQFEPVSGYSSVNAKDIWKLFRDEFPQVEEHQQLSPKFETFGGGGSRNEMQFNFGPAPLRSRLWFISEDHDHLIQFQDDRFLLNWRNRSQQSYPRYEAIAESFEKHFRRLDAYFQENFNTKLAVNQAEVTYINIIPVDDYSEVGKWISIFSDSLGKLENMNLAFNEVVLNEKGVPFARMTHELQSVLTAGEGKQRKALQLTLTFRGAPNSSDICDGMELAREGREQIVTKFSQLSSQFADKKWGKK